MARTVMRCITWVSSSCVCVGVFGPRTHALWHAFPGIIDILQQYDTKKSLETIFKSFVTKKSTISSVNPTQYGDRFKEFMAQITE